ncbi:Cytochrome c peroxidase, partial [Durusdinium trenchii]
ELNAVDVAAVKADVADLLEDEKHDDGSFGPVLVRLAWHSSGTYDKNTGKGGSEGAGMRFASESGWGANAGLDIARARLEPVKAKYPNLSYSDLWVLAGSTAIEEMGGPELPFRSGRKDKTEEEAAKDPLPDGLLPDADGRDKPDKIADHLRDIFYKMGMNDREIVALSGAHALGRCHPEASGFWGPWTRAPTTFSNEYFRLLLEEKWTKKTKHEGKAWTGPEQFEDKTGDLMMLPSDLALTTDPEMKKYVEMYAKDEALFFKDFAAAWTKLTENGCANLV